MIHLGNILEELLYDSLKIIPYSTSYVLILEQEDNTIEYINLITEPVNE
jgi:hypothetical protein